MEGSSLLTARPSNSIPFKTLSDDERRTLSRDASTPPLPGGSRRRGGPSLRVRRRQQRRKGTRGKDAENSVPRSEDEVVVVGAGDDDADGEVAAKVADHSMWAPGDELAVSDAVERALDSGKLATPCLIIDVDVVQRSYEELTSALPRAKVYYAVKANPEPLVLRRLARLGSCFDVASPGEVDMALAAGATPDRVSFGNTIKKERDIIYAYSRGVRLFAFDSDAEIEKLARSAPGASVFCRILAPEDPAAEWPLSKKFGCYPEMADRLLTRAAELGLRPVGVSFHVGSQMNNTRAWRNALALVAKIFDNHPNLTLVNLGGGYPARYTREVPHMSEYGRHIMEGIHEFFGDRPLDLIVEPGRSMVGNAGVLDTEVVLISKKSDAPDAERWVYLDCGLFGGLAETMGESIKYRLRCGSRGDKLGRVVLAGPTCDSADVMYEKTAVYLPLDLEVGDRIQFLTTGAYTTTYCAVAFNGFLPLKAYCVNADEDAVEASAPASSNR